MKKRILSILLCAFLFLLMGCNRYNKPIEFDAQTWNAVDMVFYSDEKYGMALWLIENTQLVGLNTNDLCQMLYEGNQAQLSADTENNVISIPLRNTKNHFGPFTYYDETAQVIDAYMRIYLNDDIVTEAEVVTITKNKFVVVKSTND